jgi:GNAT superfamily N-acetyltransferase
MIRRARTAADFARCAEISNAVHPDQPVTADVIASAPGVCLVHDDGYAYVGGSSIPDSAFAMVRVRPETRRRGVGGALLAESRAQARDLGCASLWGRVHEGDEATLAFAAHRGFEEVNREFDVLLEIAPGDGDVAPGIEELRAEHVRGTYAIAAECIPDMALPQHAEVQPFEEWLAEEQRNSPVAFVALDGEEVVGYARLYSMPAVPRRLENGFTGVRRSHRRRGIATALKRAQIAWAAAHGYTELVTSSVETNKAMRGVNERLGYMPLPGWIVVQGAVQ